MLEYFEVPPPPALADTVECFWKSNQMFKAPYKHVVPPDGCADLLFTRTGGVSNLQFVGPMTKPTGFTLPPGQLSVAVRFHPGCWTHLVHLDADLLTDRIVPFETVALRAGHCLSEQLSNQAEPEHLIRILAASIRPKTPSRLSSVLRYLAQSPQQVSLDALAFNVGLSTRQFRRCIRQDTGLSPKLLARICRFRCAAARLRSGEESHADLAASCGYFDQSHFIAEYRHFTGQTPAAIDGARPASAQLSSASTTIPMDSTVL